MHRRFDRVIWRLWKTSKISPLWLRLDTVENWRINMSGGCDGSGGGDGRWGLFGFFNGGGWWLVMAVVVAMVVIGGGWWLEMAVVVVMVVTGGESTVFFYKMWTVHHNVYSEDPYAKEFGIKISQKLAQVEARILPAPGLRYHDSSRDRDCLPLVGQRNMMNKLRYHDSSRDRDCLPQVGQWNMMNRLQKDAIARYYGLEKGQVVKVMYSGELTQLHTSYRCVW
ncbi:unnamed protein product [Fraxinus pennsylvanica]|uniref:Uncharacterized protein n=1 Tax=Fraxinus pennsylvanica TaxID=56036 RepID=A0AAD1ZED0_9LAMI|nr:unnamed protein product [Fraxinus pennsylvanica]